MLCVVGMDPCDDYVTCTEDVCLEETDTCDHTPMDAWCDNGVFCDGVEVCDTVAGCGDGPDPCVDLAHCDEVGDACYECLSAAECDDGLFCNGAEQCVSHVCLDGLHPCEDSCERCDETEGTCIWCMFDLDFDGFIGPGDFSYLAGCYGAYYDCDPPTYRSGADGCCAANFDGSADSFVGPGDFAGFVGCWGDVCSACSNCWEAGAGRPGLSGRGRSVPDAYMAGRDDDVEAEARRTECVERTRRYGRSRLVEQAGGWKRPPQVLLKCDDNAP